MSRRETAVCCAVGAFLVLFSSGCRRRTDKARSAVLTLKGQIDSLTLTVSLAPVRQGEEDPNPGLRSVLLHVATLRLEPPSYWPDGTPATADSLISAREARKLIGVLVDAGFFEEAGKYHSPSVAGAAEKAPPPAGSKPYVPAQSKERHCTITAIVTDGSWHTYYIGVLAWGPQVTRRLQVLRKAVGGDAASLLDQLLAQVAVHSADRGDAADETRESRSPSLTRSERSQFIRAAQAELERLIAPWEERKPAVVLNGDEVTVTFPPPKGARAGEFIIRMERETKKILDVNIWR